MFVVLGFGFSVKNVVHGFHVSVEFFEVRFFYMSQLLFWLFKYLIRWRNFFLKPFLKVILRRCISRGGGKHLILNGS